MPYQQPYGALWTAVQEYGVEWPASDEDQVRKVAEAWRAAGAAFATAGDGSADGLRDAWTDSVGQDYKKTVDQLRADSLEAGQNMTHLGNLTGWYADDVAAAKRAIGEHVSRWEPLYDRLMFWNRDDAERYAANEAAILNDFLDRVASNIATRGAGGKVYAKDRPQLTEADDPGTYRVPPPDRKADVGAYREQRVAELVGGTVIGVPGRPGLTIRYNDGGRVRETDVDVIGPNGEFITVGGPQKEIENNDPADPGKVIVKLAAVQDAAVKQGTHAEAWFTRETPPGVVEQARGLVGPENVHLFDE